MAQNDRYRKFEQVMTTAAILDAALFFLYLITAGILWLKIMSAVLTIAIALGGLAVLYLSKELLRQRSLWMSCAFFAVLCCIVCSVILSFP